MHALTRTFVIIGILFPGISCEKESSGVFHMKISDGTGITEDDIMFYDSSTCILFLEEKIYLSYQEPDSGRLFRNEFSVFVDDKEIYSGLIFPEEIITCAGPPRTYIIQRDKDVLDRSVMEIAFAGESPDLRNDPRIIDALESDGLLRSGISFTIDQVEVLGRFTKTSSHVDAVLDWFGPTNFLTMDECGSSMSHNDEKSPESSLIGGPIQSNKEKCYLADPATYANAETPPFLIFHGDEDSLVPHCQSEYLHEKLRSTGVESELVIVRGGKHGPGVLIPEHFQKMISFFNLNRMDS